MEKSLPKELKRQLIHLLRIMRTEYCPYNKDDMEVIVAIDLIKEELEFNVKDEETL